MLESVLKLNNNSILKLIRSKFSYVFILVFFLIISSLNVGGNFIIHFIDMLWPLVPLQNFYSDFQAWNMMNLGGYAGLQSGGIAFYPIYIALDTIIPWIPAQEVIFLTLSQAIASIYFYRILDKFIFKKFILRGKIRIFALVILAIFSVSNYTVQWLFWWNGVPPAFLFLVATYAMLFYSMNEFKRYLSTGQHDYTSLAFFSFFAIFVFLQNVPFNIAPMLMIFLIPLIFSFKQTRVNVVREIKFYVISLSLIFLVSIIWLVPSYLETVLSPSSSILGGAAAYNMGLFKGVTSQLNFFTILGGIYAGYNQYGYYAINRSIFYGVGVPAGYLTVIFLLLSLFLGKGNLRSFLPILGVVTIISLLSLGVNSPLYVVDLYLFKSPLLLLFFRNPITATSFLLSVYSLFLYSMSIDRLTERVRTIPMNLQSFKLKVRNVILQRSYIPSRSWQKVIAIIVIIFISVQYVSVSTPIYSGDAIPHSPLNARMVIPEYELNVALYLSEILRNETYYALLFPGGFLNQNWTNGYDSYDLLPLMLPNYPLISETNTGLGGTSNSLLSDVYNAIDNGSADKIGLVSRLDFLDVKYVVIEGNVSYSSYFGSTFTPAYKIILSSLNNTSNLSLIEKIGTDYVYENLDMVSMISSVPYNESSSVLPMNFKDNAIVRYVKLSPTNYKISLTGIKGDNPLLIVFRQNFAPGWTVQRSINVQGFEMEDYNGTFVGIVIYPEKGASSASFYLFYSPQRIYSFGIVIGILSMISPFVVLLSYDFLKNRKERYI